MTSQAVALPEVVEDAAVLLSLYDAEAIAWGLQRVVVLASLPGVGRGMALLTLPI